MFRALSEDSDAYTRRGGGRIDRRRLLPTRYR